MDSWQNFESNFGATPFWVFSDLTDPSRGSFQVTKQPYCVAPKFHSKFCQEFKNHILKFFSLKMDRKLLKNGLKREYYTFLFWIINCFLKISILNRLLLSSWLELVILFLCYDFKLGVSPKYAIQMGRWVYTIYWTNMVKINHINHRRPPNIISSLSTFFENKRDCMLIDNDMKKKPHLIWIIGFEVAK